jgi:glucose-6-phosphate isomerase
MSDTTIVPDTKEWKALQAHYESARALELRDLFKADPGRAERFSVEAAGLFLDYSKNRVTDETMRLLLDLAPRAGGRRAA